MNPLYESFYLLPSHPHACHTYKSHALTFQSSPANQVGVAKIEGRGQVELPGNHILGNPTGVEVEPGQLLVELSCHCSLKNTDIIPSSKMRVAEMYSGSSHAAGSLKLILNEGFCSRLDLCKVINEGRI